MTRRQGWAFLLGVRDGWREPHDLSTSTNVEHLDDEYGMGQEWLDRGINIGQALRAGHRSQSWQEGFWPFGWNRKGSA